MSVWSWIFDLLEMFSGLWEWLGSPVLENELLPAWATTPISIISVGALGTIFIYKIVALVVPN